MVTLDRLTDLIARFRRLENFQGSSMRTFFQQYGEDLRVMASRQEKIDREGLLKMRAQIDRMMSPNMRQAAVAMWHAKVNLGAR